MTSPNVTSFFKNLAVATNPSNALHLSIVDIDEGYCRVLYRLQRNGASYYYSLQEDFKDTVNLYRNSLPPWCEPESITTFKPEYRVTFERPQGDSQLVKAVNKWITNFNEKDSI
jgi:hypothetical protein